MSDEKLKQKNYEYVRLVLPLMSMHDIPITPKNYTVWYTHVSGDCCELSETINRMIERGRDFFARYGGEEFAVLLPQTPLSGAEKVAENIRKYFSGSPIKTVTGSLKLGNITVSIGVASYRSGESIEELIYRADKALYCAKETGRNRVVTA